MREIIKKLCKIHPLTLSQLGILLKREKAPLRNNYLSSMVKQEILEYEYPFEKNRPDQAYKLKKEMDEKLIQGSGRRGRVKINFH